MTEKDKESIVELFFKLNKVLMSLLQDTCVKITKYEIDSWMLCPTTILIRINHNLPASNDAIPIYW